MENNYINSFPLVIKEIYGTEEVATASVVNLKYLMVEKFSIKISLIISGAVFIKRHARGETFMLEAEKNPCSSESEIAPTNVLVYMEC